ncbi:Putative DEHA2G13156p [Penicillium brasilianum]|uniref:Putative DEHA2G13156p n=1 Tax=Penicillium brasilianum TaxID=104259 RepID=A0A0F7TT19_PENBI|nr:Putative DEHA2G13156p [Penicillium brasilianum]
MFYQWEQHPNQDRRHRPRTRNGCLTCRRRKVRCDEKRPDCGHCSRLRLDCSWQEDSGLRLGVRTKRIRQRLQQKPQSQQQPAQPEPATANAETSGLSASDEALQAPDALVDDDFSFNRMFSYASFMWDDSSPTDLSPGWDTFDLTSSQELVPWSDASLSIPTSIPSTCTNPMANTEALLDRQGRFSSITSPTIAIGWSETQLAEYFARSAAPPILATVETSARWFWMRKQLTSMTSTSRMVKFGVIAFVALELESAGTLEPSTYTQYYRTAKERLEECLKDISRDRKIISSQLRHILAVLFLLSYVDLLTKDVSKAHANLREGFHALEMVEIDSLSVTERRLLSWLRLLDARAVSAGGEGLFLTEGDSAVNTDLQSPDSSIAEVDSGLDDAEAALEEFIMRPAFLFFQKVQLFMGRISKIDPWHRRRGTVEDETEVMAISTTITRDIKSLWQQRPPLMDHAVAGKLATLLSPSLAETITRTMRVYHANYYASFIHLHRVAYKNLPRTADVMYAMNEIRQVTKMILESPWISSPQEIPAIGTPNASTTTLPSLPVNMLWPLLMLGVEVEEPEERTWVISCIKGMENVASNAGITADVLQEVIRRQDETRQRVDIRKVMHETFDRAFAIV